MRVQVGLLAGSVVLTALALTIPTATRHTPPPTTGQAACPTTATPLVTTP